MEILQTLLDTIRADRPTPVRKVIIGLHWVLVASKYCGLGSVLPGEGPHGHGSIRDVGSLHHKSAQELAQWVLSDNPLEASIGIATINSLLDINESRMEQVNAAEVIARQSQDKNLVIVGHFPFVGRMKTIARNCWVIEKRPLEGDLPEEAAREFVPQADVVAITGTAFINHTMEGLLALCHPSAKVMVLGPSTPLSPLLFDYGITFLSGSRVADEEAAILTIQQGAHFPQVKGVRLLTMTKPA